MLKDKLMEDLKVAMRAQDKDRLGTIRLLRAALMKKEIELREGGTATLTTEQEMVILQKQAKQRRDSIEQFNAAGRTDLSEKEAVELAIIEAYLPEQFDEDKLKTIVQDTITSVGATSMRDIGKVMGAIMPKVKGRADGRQVQALVRAVLSEKG